MEWQLEIETTTCILERAFIWLCEEEIYEKQEWFEKLLIGAIMMYSFQTFNSKK